MLAQVTGQVYSASQTDIVFSPALPDMIVVFQLEDDASFTPTCRNTDTPICYPPILVTHRATAIHPSSVYAAISRDINTLFALVQNIDRGISNLTPESMQRCILRANRRETQIMIAFLAFSSMMAFGKTMMVIP